MESLFITDPLINNMVKKTTLIQTIKKDFSFQLTNFCSRKKSSISLIKIRRDLCIIKIYIPNDLTQQHFLPIRKELL